MYSEAVLEPLIQRIYEAATGTADWLTFLVAFATALDSGNPSLFFADSSGPDSGVMISVGLDQKMSQAYDHYYSQRNVWLQGARPLLKPGSVRSSNMLCPRKTFLRSEWYTDFCRRLNWSQALAATIFQDDTITSNIGVFSDVRRPDYCEDDFALVRALMPHLQRGLKMHQHLATSKPHGKALQAVLNGLSTPVLLVTAFGKVLFMNTAAERLVSTQDGLLVEAGQLRALRPNDTRSLSNLLGSAAETSAKKGRKSGGTLKVSRTDGRAHLDVLISPIRTHEDWILRQPAVAAIFVTDPHRASASKDAALIRLHGLTAAEARVAVALSRGLAGKEICGELNISYNTLRTHMKRIYLKTRTKHHNDLVRILASQTQTADSTFKKN